MCHPQLKVSFCGSCKTPRLACWIWGARGGSAPLFKRRGVGKGGSAGVCLKWSGAPTSMQTGNTRAGVSPPAATYSTSFPIEIPMPCPQHQRDGQPCLLHLHAISVSAYSTSFPVACTGCVHGCVHGCVCATHLHPEVAEAEDPRPVGDDDDVDLTGVQ